MVGGRGKVEGQGRHQVSGEQPSSRPSRVVAGGSPARDNREITTASCDILAPPSSPMSASCFNS
jgi:hypothetical protein